MTKIGRLIFINLCILIIVQSIFIDRTKVLASETKNILILNSYHKGLTWSDELEQGIFSELNTITNRNLDIKVEYMDIKENDDNLYYKKLIDLYIYKYKDKKFDLVICIDNPAFEFLFHYGEKLFPNVPIVFSDVNNLEAYNLETVNNMTGVTEEEDVEDNIKLILSLHPNTKNITAIIDKSSFAGRNLYNTLKIIENSHRYDVNFHIIRDMTLSKTVKEINKLPSDNVLMFMATYMKNDNNAKIYSTESLKFLKSNTNIPTYGIWNTELTYGIIGGKLAFGLEAGKCAGKIAVKIIQGASPSDIPIQKFNNINYVFDYNELKKFSIKIDELPKNSTIINTPPSVYSIAKDKLKNIVYAISIVFAIIIIFLIRSVRKSKKLEEVLNDKKIHLEENVGFLRTLLDTIPNPIYCKNLRGEYTDCNIHYEKMFGLKREEIIGKTISDVYRGDFSEILYMSDLMLMKTGGTQVYECKLKDGDKTNREILFSKALLKNSNDKATGIVGVMVDITERKRIEDKINRLSKLRESMLEVNQSIIGMTDIKELFELILEKAINCIDGAKCGNILVLSEDNNLVMISFKGYGNQKVEDFNIPLEHSFYWIKTKGEIKNTVIIDDFDYLQLLEMVGNINYSEKWKVRSCISSPIIINNKLYGLLNIYSDKLGAFLEDDLQIMEYLKAQVEISIGKHKLYEEITYFSRYDNLTNIYNRKTFKDILYKELNHVETFSLVMFDINKLKYVNDTYGHLIGDCYIKTFVQGLKTIIGEKDIIARYGGDEFVGVFHDNEENVTARLEALIEYFKINPLIFESSKIVCSFSYGIAVYPNDSNKYDKLLELADDRMYVYKQSTRENRKQ